jgi:type I restriction enzyme, S subunit
VNSSRLRLYPEQFLRTSVLVPPLDEQAAIVRFLDWANSRLERAIRAKRKVIGLLKEQQQAIIQRAVICGADPGVPRKSTNVAHLGDVPKSWELRRLKSMVTNVIDQTATKTADEIYIALEHVQSWTGLVNLQRGRDEDFFAGTVKRFRKDDVLFGKLRPYLAKVITAPSPGVCVGEFFVLRPNPTVITTNFLEQLLRTVAIIRAINSSTFGAKMPRADWQFVGNLRIALPEIQEQRAICENVQREALPLANAISRYEQEIGLLHEYRNRLVADVVTGWLDVRAAAAHLPNEGMSTGPDEPPNEIEEIDPMDEEEVPA